MRFPPFPEFGRLLPVFWPGRWQGRSSDGVSTGCLHSQSPPGGVTATCPVPHGGRESGPDKSVIKAILRSQSPAGHTRSPDRASRAAPGSPTTNRPEQRSATCSRLVGTGSTSGPKSLTARSCSHCGRSNRSRLAFSRSSSFEPSFPPIEPRHVQHGRSAALAARAIWARPVGRQGGKAEGRAREGGNCLRVLLFSARLGPWFPGSSMCLRSPGRRPTRSFAGSPPTTAWMMPLC